MPETVPLLDLTKSKEFVAAPLPNKLQALDESFIHNVGAYDEQFFTKQPFANNDEWLEGRKALTNAYSTIRSNVAGAELRSRLDQKMPEGYDPSVVQRVLAGDEIDEEEDGDGHVRTTIDTWMNDLRKTQAVVVGHNGSAPRIANIPLLNPKNDQDVLGGIEVFSDGRSTPYAEVSVFDKTGDEPKLKRTRILLKDDLKEKVKADESRVALLGKSMYEDAKGEDMRKQLAQISVDYGNADAPYLSGMTAKLDREGKAAELKDAMTHHAVLNGPEGYATNLTEQATNILKQPGYLEHIGEDGFVTGLQSATGSLLTSGMSIPTGVVSLMGIDAPGPVQHISYEKNPELAKKLVEDSKNGRMEGMVVIPGVDGVTVRQKGLAEHFQDIHDEARNAFPRRSRPEFENTPWSRVSVSATDDVLPFLADLVSGMSLAKGGVRAFATVAAKDAAFTAKEATTLGELSLKAYATGESAAGGALALKGMEKTSQALAEAVVAGKRIEQFSTIAGPMVAGLPMNIKMAASGWADAQHEADEWDKQGQPEKAQAARDNATMSAWANFATGEGLAAIPLMRMLKTAEGKTLETATREMLTARPGGTKLMDAISDRVKKSLEFGAWSAANTVSTNVWAQQLYNENREAFQGVPEAAAIGMIHGFAIGDIGKQMTPRETQTLARQQRNTEQVSDRTAESVSNQITASVQDGNAERWGHLPEVKPVADVVVANPEDGTFSINDPATPAFAGVKFPTMQAATSLAQDRHREQFLQSLRPTQDRIGMKADDIEAQNTVIGNFLDRAATLAGVDPQRLFASYEVRDRPEGEQGVADPTQTRVQRMNNLRQLITEGTRNGLPQGVLDTMQGRMDALAAEAGAEPLPPFDPTRGTDMRSRLEVRLRDYRAAQGIPDPTAPARENPWVKMGTPELEAAVKELRLMGETAHAEEAAQELEARQPATPAAPPVNKVTPTPLFRKAGENAPDTGTKTTEGEVVAEPEGSKDNSFFRKASQEPPTDKPATKAWFEDDTIPQKEFEQLVDQEMNDLNAMRQQLVDGPLMTPEQEDQAAKFIDDRQSAIIKAEVSRQSTSRDAAEGIRDKIDGNARQLEILNRQIRGEGTPRENRASTNRTLPELVRQRNALQKAQEGLFADLRALREPHGRMDQKKAEERNASIFPLVEQGKAVIEAYKTADATSLIHEISHWLTLMTDPVSGKSILEAALGQHADAFNKWLGGDKGSRAYHEKFARGTEKYLGEGKAPNNDPMLKKAFAKVARLFRGVYKDLRALNVEITPEARAGFDRLFGERAPKVKEGEEGIITAEEAKAKLQAFEDGGLMSLNQLNDPGTRQFIEEIDPIQQEPEGVAIDNIARLDQGPTKMEDLRTHLFSWRRKGGAISRKIEAVKKAPGFFAKVEEFMPAGLRGRGDLPESAFRAKLQSTGLMDGINKKAEIISGKLDAAVNLAIGIDPNPINFNYELLAKPVQDKRNALLRKINNSLLGGMHPFFSKLTRARREVLQQRMFDALPVNVKPLVMEAREHMDALSRQLIAIGAVQGDVMATVDRNRNFYMNRSYEFFDDPMWGERVRKDHPAIYDEAYNEFLKGGMTADEAKGAVDALLLRSNFEGNEADEALAKWAVDRKITSIFKHRNNEIPDFVRKLWGEHTDPFLNYTRTISKQSQVLTTHQFYLQTLHEGLTEGWIGARSEKLPAKIFGTEGKTSGAGSRRTSPLAGYYTTPEIAEVFKQVDTAGTGIYAKTMAVMAGVNWAAKNAAFTWNPSAHPKNMLGSAMLFMANGHWGNISSMMADLKMAGSAHATAILPEWWVRALESNAGLDRVAAENEQVKLTRLGLLDNNVNIGIMHSLAQRFRGAKSESDALAIVGSTAEKAFKNTQGFAEKAIQAEDSFWKVMNFYSEARALHNAYPTKTPGEIDRMAAEKTLDVFPSFNRLVPLAKTWSKNPFMGTFLAFRAETARITYNMIRHGVEELNTPGLRWLGLRRLSGLTTMRLAQAAAVSGMTKMMMGVFLDDKKKKAASHFMMPYDKFSSNAFAEFGDGKFRFINMSNIFPMSETTDAVRVLAQNESTDRVALGMVHKILEPFLQEEFSVKMAYQLANNENDFGQPIVNKEDKLIGVGKPVSMGGQGLLQGRAGDRIEYMLGTFMPGVAKSAEKMLDAYQGTGKESLPAATSRLMGLRIAEIDVRKQLPLITTDYLNRIAEADDLFEAHFAKGNEAQLKGGLEAMNASRKLLFSKLHDLFNDAIETGVPAAEAMKIMDGATDRFTKESLSKEELIHVVTDGQAPPYRISKTKFIQHIQKDPARAAALLEMTGQPIKK